MFEISRIYTELQTTNATYTRVVITIETVLNHKIK